MDLSRYTIWLPTLTLVAVRVAGLMLVAPIFGHAAIPARLRIFLSIAIALPVVGGFAAPVNLPDNWFDLVAALGGELAIGAGIGYAARLVFAGVELGAEQIGQQMGIALAEVLDPMAEDPSGILRRLYQLLAIVIFLAIGGHRDLISAMLGSFHVVPLLGFPSPGAFLDAATGVLAASFVLAMKVAAPVLIAMLLAAVAMGFIQRTIPQMNVFSTELSVRAMAGMVVMAASLAVVAPLIEGAWKLTGGALSGLGL